MAKQKTRRSKGWKKRILNKGTIFTILACAALIYLAYTFLFLSGPNSNANGSIQYKAAIVDQLNLTQSNQTFVEMANSTLTSAGFKVDYYSGTQVTVDFYRDLPSRGYGFIILRVHSAPVLKYDEEGNIIMEKSYISFFTNENYSDGKYVEDQLNGQVVKCEYYNGSPLYFGVTPDFFRYSANGRFNNSIIVMMGCWGLYFTKMADTLVKQGARVYVAWDRAVMASRTDTGTLRFLQHFVTESKTMGVSVLETMTEVGADPKYNSSLTFWPFTTEMRDFVLPKSSSIVNVAPTILESVRRDPRKALKFIH